MLSCIFPHCPGHDDRLDQLLHGQQHLLNGQDALARLMRAHITETEHDMENIDGELTTLEGDENAEQASLTALTADEERELVDLQALKNAGQTLTPDQQARFDTLDAAIKANTAALDADTAAIDTADPAPAPATDSGTTSDASDGSAAAVTDTTAADTTSA